MPRLHQYRDRNACYVLTAIRGAVVTFQLTAEGEKKLAAARIGPGEQFPRALLLDLYRTGDAFTGGNTAATLALDSAGQLEMDFANDPDPETAFPACDVCRSVNDLYLTIAGNPDDLVAQLQCATCRNLPTAHPDSCIPLGLLSRPVLSRLFQVKTVGAKSSGVKQFEELLRAEFESKWEALRKRRGTPQKSLFDVPPADGLNLPSD
jgi:hypothetical protein